MYIHTPESLQQVRFKKNSDVRNSKSSAIYHEIDKLSVGQGLQLEKVEWVRKTPPTHSIFPSYLKSNDRKFSVKQLDSELGGWVIIRIN